MSSRNIIVPMAFTSHKTQRIGVTDTATIDQFYSTTFHKQQQAVISLLYAEFAPLLQVAPDDPADQNGMDITYSCFSFSKLRMLTNTQVKSSV